MALDDNKVDLSSVNKQSKQSLYTKLKNLSKNRKKPAGPGRDHLGQFASGSGGLKSANKLNLTRVLPLILVVALVGGYMVYRSFAGSYTFVRYASKGQITGSTVRRSSAHKSLHSRPATIVPVATLKKTKNICAHWKTFGSGPWGRIKIEQIVSNRMVSSNWVDWSNSKKSGNVCTPVRSHSNSTVRVSWIFMGGSQLPEIGVDTIYGKP